MSASPRGRALLVVVAASLLAACPAPPRADLLLRGGWLVDGNGTARRRADVAIRDGRIVAVGDLSGRAAGRVVDVSGLVVAPGFVDLHSHADLILLAGAETQQRLLQAKIRQGVTTIVIGNCGLGTAPADEEAAEVLSGINAWMTPDGAGAGPLGVGEYLGRLERIGVVLNVATLVPHGPLRISVMGLAGGAPAADQLDAMRDGLREALEQGALGLSVGLIYPPGMYSPTDELVALAEVVAERDRLFTAHVRGSSETLLRATVELIEIGEHSGARVHHSHLEAVGERFWPEVDRVLELEDAARADGLRLSHDVFPYTRAATMMGAIFPPWALEGGVPALLQRLRDPASRERIRRELQERRPEWPPWQPGGWPHNLVGAVGWDGISVASVAGETDTGMVGRDLEEIGRATGRDPFDVVADLMLSEDGRVGQLVGEISGRAGRIEPLLTILRHPAGAIVSDAEDYGRGSPHPAHAGAFARALRLAREGSLLSLEQTVRRMTSVPASIAGLPARGTVRVGAAADLVVFDAEQVADRATWDEPRRVAGGIEHVLINGGFAVEDGRWIGGLHGAVLRAE